MLVTMMVILTVAMVVVVGCGGKEEPAGENTRENTDTGAAAEESYYQGKTLTMIIPHSPGGGFDTYARTIAPYLEKELGVEIIAKQAKGAGGVLGTNLLWKSKLTVK